MATLPADPPKAESDQTPEQRAVLNEVRQKFERSERNQKPIRARWNVYYSQYRPFTRLRREYAEADRDERRSALKREFGERLNIPYVYAIIETILPRAIANDPSMIGRPKNPDGRESAKKVTQRFERDQEEINYEMKLQATARRGFVFGLGIQKTYWHRSTAQRPFNRQATLPERLLGRGLSGYVTEYREETLFDGPMAEDVDIFDFFWDPAAKDIETCGYAVHRTWRDFDYIAQKVNSGAWDPVDLEAVKGGADETGMSEAWAERRDVTGDASGGDAIGPKYEVWEYNQGDRVVAVLNKTLVVKEARDTTFHRELPYQAFRPTPVPGEFAGIGEVEPVAPLQEELDEMRSNRLDNSWIVMQTPFGYAEGMVDPDDLVIGPGEGIPTVGDPRSSLFPLEIGTVPGTSFEETGEIKTDIERTSGISDPVSGGEGTTAATETATGIQLIQQAANVRIRQKTKNLEREVIRPAARQWLALYRQNLLETEDMMVPDPESPQGYTFTQIANEDFEAVRDVVPEAGSTEPESIPQKRQDAAALYNQLRGDPSVSQRMLVRHLLTEHDIPAPESWLAPEGVPVDPMVLGEVLRNEGIPEDVILPAVEKALEAAQPQAPEGPESQPQPMEAAQ